MSEAQHQTFRDWAIKAGFPKYDLGRHANGTYYMPHVGQMFQTWCARDAEIAKLQAEVEQWKVREIEWRALLRDLHIEMAAAKLDRDQIKSWQESAVETLRKYLSFELQPGDHSPQETADDECRALLGITPAPLPEKQCGHDPMKPGCTLMHQFNQPGRTTCTVCKGMFWLPTTTAQSTEKLSGEQS